MTSLNQHRSPAVRRRSFLALAVALGTIPVLSACGREEVAGSDASSAPIASGPATGELTVWAQGTEAEALPKMLDEFTAANPDLTVNITAIPWDAAHNKYQTSIAAGNTPDVAQMGTTWMTDFGDAFETVPTEIPLDSFFESSLSSVTLGGAKRGVPWYVDTRVIYYRSDLAAKAGYSEMPSDWAGFKAFGKALQEKAGAEHGFTLPARGADSFQSMLPFAWSTGVSLMNADATEWTLDTPEMAEALDYYRSLFDDGIADKNPSLQPGSIEASFISGTSPVFIAGPSGIGSLRTAAGDESVDATYKVAVVPGKNSGVGTSFIGGSNLVVFKESKNRDAAWKFVQWLSQPATQLRFYQLAGDLPAVEKVWEDPALAEDEKLSVFGEQLKNSRSVPTVASWTQVSAAGDTMLEQILTAGKDPEEALKGLQAEAGSLGLGR